MKKYMLTLALPVIFLFTFSSCGEDEPEATETIWEILESKTELSGIAGQLEEYGFKDALSAAGDMTLFAPSNTALNNLLATLGIDDFSPIRLDIANAVLSYHVANSKLLSDAVTAGSTITTSQGEAISVVAAGGGVALSTGATTDATFDDTDILATNGVVHIVNVVLVPPTIGAIIVQTLSSVAQPILLSSSFTTLSAAIAKADQFAAGASQPTLVSTLIDATKTFTVFAPVDAVFEQGGITIDTFTGQQWYGLILNHVVLGNYGSGGSQTAFSAGQSITTLAGLNLTVLTTSAPTNPAAGITSGVAIDSNGDTTPEAQIALENAGVAGNGVVHAIAGVLSPN